MAGVGSKEKKLKLVINKQMTVLNNINYMANVWFPNHTIGHSTSISPNV